MPRLEREMQRARPKKEQFRTFEGTTTIFRKVFNLIRLNTSNTLLVIFSWSASNYLILSYFSYDRLDMSNSCESLSPAGSFFPDLSRTPMICSFRSTDETSDNSFGLGSNRGTSLTTDGNGRRAPTIDVASVLGTPENRRLSNLKLSFTQW